MRRSSRSAQFVFGMTCVMAFYNGGAKARAEISAGWDVAVTADGIGEGPLVGTAVDSNVTIVPGSAGDVDLNGLVELPDIGDGSSNNVPGAYVVQNWVISDENPDPYVGFEISSTTALDLSTFEIVVRRERQNTPSRIRDIYAAFSTDGVNLSDYIVPDADGLGAVIGSGRNGVSIREAEAIDTNVLTPDELKIWNLEQFSGTQSLTVRIQARFTGDSSSWNEDSVLFIDDRGDFDTSTPLEADSNTNNFFQPGSSTDGLDVILTTPQRWSAGTGDWLTGTNWAAAATPQASWDAVVVNNVSAAPETVNIASDSSIRALKIRGGTGPIAVSVGLGATLTTTDIVQVQNGGTLDLQGNVSTLSVQVADGGALTGVGQIQGSLKNAGLLSPGNSVGTMTVTGGFRQVASGVLSAEIGGTTAGSDYDQLNIGELVALDGELSVAFLGGFEASYGDAFDIVTAAEIFNQFASYDLPSLAEGLAWSVDYQESLVQLKVGLAGDFDVSGTVDGADFLAWQRGESLNPLSSEDLAAWQANFGATAASIAAVPEPTTATLLSGGVILATIAASRRRES